jgi:hypothetical protein
VAGTELIRARAFREPGADVSRTVVVTGGYVTVEREML